MSSEPLPPERWERKDIDAFLKNCMMRFGTKEVCGLILRFDEFDAIRLLWSLSKCWGRNETKSNGIHEVNKMFPPPMTQEQKPDYGVGQAVFAVFYSTIFKLSCVDDLLELLERVQAFDARFYGTWNQKEGEDCQACDFPISKHLEAAFQDAVNLHRFRQTALGRKPWKHPSKN